MARGVPLSGDGEDSREHSVALERLRHRHVPTTTTGSEPGRRGATPGWRRMLWLPLVAAAALLLPLGVTPAVAAATPTMLTPARGGAARPRGQRRPALR